MKILISIIVVSLILGLGVVYLSARPQPGPVAQDVQNLAKPTSTQPAPLALATSTHAVGTATATPAIIAVNTPTQVTVTVQITDPTLIQNSVNLLLLGASGTQPTVLGVMQSVPNGLYSLQPVFNEPTTGQIQLEVSAAFQGLLKRVISPIVQIPVWNARPATYTDPSFSIIIPENWTAASQTSTAAEPADSVRSVSFSLPTDPVPILYIFIYPHGADVVDQADEPPGFLGSNNTYDFYFQMRNAPTDSSTLTTLDLTPGGLEQELLQVVGMFKTD
jgi:hypothetical protein